MVTGGNAQRGAAGNILSQPLQVVVIDSTGHPVSHVLVQWFADDGGQMAPSTSLSDAAGVAQSNWRLGLSDGTHQARAQVTEATATFTATVPPLLSGMIDSLPIPLAFTTYDGSGETVHPDYLALPETMQAAWGGATQLLALTPYPGGAITYENPSLYSGPDAAHWSPLADAVNPVVLPDTGYLSDPDLVYVPDSSQVWLYYRAVTNENEIRLTRSADGAHWTPPVNVAVAPDHEIVSPAVVRRGPLDWYMWSVNAEESGCDAAATTVERRTSSDGVHWSKPTQVALDQDGVYAWHIDVSWIDAAAQYWALFNGKAPGNCNTKALYLATSSDGLHWTTYPSPVLTAGVIPALSDIVYRSTLSYDPETDIVTLWYSGAHYQNGAYVWGTAVQRRARAELFATAQAAMPARSVASLRAETPTLVDGP